MIVVASTVPPYVTDQDDSYLPWLYNAEQIRASHPDGVQYFCSIEVDQRGLAPFEQLTGRLCEVDGNWWTFSLDDGAEEIHTNNRLRRITLGQNLAFDYACADPRVSHILFMAADTEPPADCLPRLLELEHPIVGGDTPTYGLTGPEVKGAFVGCNRPLGGTPCDHSPERRCGAYWKGYPFPVQRRMACMTLILLHRSVFNRIRCRWDLDRGLSDDPAMYADTRELLGLDTYVRMDVRGRHYPESIGAIETRGHDRILRRRNDARAHTG